MLAEYLVGGLTAGRLRQLAARVVAVHQMVEGASFPDVHQAAASTPGCRPVQAFTITIARVPIGWADQGRRVPAGSPRPRQPPRAGGALDPLWLGKMPLTEFRSSRSCTTGACSRTRCSSPLPRRPAAQARLARHPSGHSLAALIGDPQ